MKTEIRKILHKYEMVLRNTLSNTFVDAIPERSYENLINDLEKLIEVKNA